MDAVKGQLRPLRLLPVCQSMTNLLSSWHWRFILKSIWWSCLTDYFCAKFASIWSQCSGCSLDAREQMGVVPRSKTGMSRPHLSPSLTSPSVTAVTEAIDSKPNYCTVLTCFKCKVMETSACISVCLWVDSRGRRCACAYLAFSYQFEEHNDRSKNMTIG